MRRWFEFLPPAVQIRARLLEKLTWLTGQIDEEIFLDDETRGGCTYRARWS
jgi:hypothetical protein